MKKKYFKPEMQVVEIGSYNLLAGSDYTDQFAFMTTEQSGNA